MTAEISRPEKLTHAQTMLYEIDMLRHTLKRLSENRWQTEMDKWVCLESFLVHFRNLIEFFGHNAPRTDDLHITKPGYFWQDLTAQPSGNILARLHRNDLWQKYESRQDKISKYLHHCTETRIDSKAWPIGEMYADIAKLIDEFERLLPSKRRTWNAPSGNLNSSSLESASTATVTQSVVLYSTELGKPKTKS
jgi:hypothetical protein